MDVTKIEFPKLFVMQRLLDKHIAEKRGLQGRNLMQEKILALSVEISELANETRCFKFWSAKPASAKGILLEEYVDGIHFLLSIGLEFGHTPYIIEPYQVKSGKLTEQFITLNKQVAAMEQWTDKTTHNQFVLFYQDSFALFLGLGEMLDFTAEEIQAAYMKKHEINYERQAVGY